MPLAMASALMQATAKGRSLCLVENDRQEAATTWHVETKDVPNIQESW